MLKFPCVSPNQDWKEITELFKNHFESIAPKAVTVKVTPHHGGQGYVTPIDNIGYKAARKLTKLLLEKHLFRKEVEEVSLLLPYLNKN